MRREAGRRGGARGHHGVTTVITFMSCRHGAFGQNASADDDADTMVRTLSQLSIGSSASRATATWEMLRQQLRAKAFAAQHHADKPVVKHDTHDRHGTLQTAAASLGMRRTASTPVLCRSALAHHDDEMVRTRSAPTCRHHRSNTIEPAVPLLDLAIQRSGAAGRSRPRLSREEPATLLGDQSPVPDPAVVQGSLPNGVRYLMRPHPLRLL